MSINNSIYVNEDLICSIDDINYYYLSLEELKTIAIPIISEYMYSHLSDAIKKEIVNSIQKAVDIACKPFIRDEKIDEILENVRSIY